MNIPRHSVEMVGLTDQTDDVTDVTQFAVLDPDGRRSVYGDQSWVAYGRVLRDAHPDGRIQFRQITISYGEWTDVPA